MMGPQACDVDGMSAGANPLSRFLDSASMDPMQAQMMGKGATERYLYQDQKKARSGASVLILGTKFPEIF